MFRFPNFRPPGINILAMLCVWFGAFVIMTAAVWPTVHAQAQSEAANAGRNRGLAAASEPVPLRLSLELTGALPESLELEEDVRLADLVRALAALAAEPLPPDSALPVAPVADTAAWSTVRSLDVDFFTEIAPAPGHTLRVLTIELENLDDHTWNLPHAAADDPLAAFDREADSLPLQAVAVDRRGRPHPAAAVLCGARARLVPGGRLPCRLVWQVPDGLELAAVELVVPARLRLPIGEAE